MRKQVEDKKKNDVAPSSLLLLQAFPSPVILTSALGCSLLKSMASGIFLLHLSLLQRAALPSYQNHSQFFSFTPPPNPNLGPILAIVFAPSLFFGLACYYFHCRCYFPSLTLCVLLPSIL